VITLLQHIAKMSTAAKLSSPFLSERTSGRAYATMLRLSSVCDVCIVAKRCVLEHKLLLTAYTNYKVVDEKSIGTKIND